MVVGFTAAKFKPVIFSVTGFALSYVANMVILMILYDLCLVAAEVCYIIVYMRKVEIYSNREPVCTVHLGKLSAPRLYSEDRREKLVSRSGRLES
jgi:hypothetical protein